MVRRRARPTRQRIGRVSLYCHHGSWWIYYRNDARQVRQRVADEFAVAEEIAANIKSQLVSAEPTLLRTFQLVPLPKLRRKCLQHHELVLKSSIGTVRRYRSATQHLIDFAGEIPAHKISADGFALFFREREISPNGHQNIHKRPLRDKGVRNILEICRSPYAYANRARHLPPIPRTHSQSSACATTNWNR